MSEKVEKPVNVKMLYVGNNKRDLNLLHMYYLQFKICIYFENEKRCGDTEVYGNNF